MLDLILALLLVCTLALLILPGFNKYYQRKQQQHLLQRIHLLFADSDPFQLANQARHLREKAQDLTYGEILLHTWFALLAKLSPQPGQVFYDLGSGCGKVLIATKLRYPTLTVKGVEILDNLRELGEKKWRQYCRSQQLVQAEQIYFIAGDFLQHSFEDANIIWLNATSLSEVTWQLLLEQLLHLKAGTKIIITTKTLPESYFYKTYQAMELMSWGYASTYIYEKI